MDEDARANLRNRVPYLSLYLCRAAALFHAVSPQDLGITHPPKPPPDREARAAAADALLALGPFRSLAPPMAVKSKFAPTRTRHSLANCLAT